MKVILLSDVPKVGNRHDVKDLADGYAQNVLIAKGLAVLATVHELGKLADYKSKKAHEKEAKSFAELIASVDKKTVILKIKTNNKGHLFSAVQKKDIAQAIEKTSGIVLEESFIGLPKPIKEIGSHTIKIKKDGREGECQIVVEKL